MAERLANLGYFGLKKETTKGTAVTPNVFVPIYEESLTTEANFVEDNPIVGNKFKRYQVLRGNRSHKGEVTVMGEPNTIGYLFDMLLDKGSTTGSDPYTHPFTLASTDPNSYTVDICVGAHVQRFIGVEASSIASSYEAGELRPKLSLSALKSWQGREVSSVTGSGPYNIIFKTDYDPSPTTGLVVGDTLQIYDVSLGTYIDCIVDTITDGTTIVVSENVSAGTSGDFVTIKPQTPSFSLLDPFLWGRTEFRFAADASTALSATHTPLDEGTEWNIIHEFNNEDGEPRSGSHDPASLARKQGDAEFNIKKFFDDPLELERFNAITKRACVIRHFSGTNKELRITLNNLKLRTNPKPPIKTEEILYSEVEYAPVLDSSDGQGMDVKVINSVSSI